ncbi:MAG: tRNA (N6-isopentenyl adenosine(37)-C2)-methylthiotransferase MiaB, partial [Pyrinomonadaceae bacterium]
MKKVYLETFGCQMNVSDSERISTSLVSNGFEMTADENAADVILLNTCSVREKAEHKLYTRIGQIRKYAAKSPRIGVLGCVAQLEGETIFQKADGVDFVVGTQAVGRVSEAIENVFAGRAEYFDLGQREENYDWSVAESQRSSPYIAFVPIIEGCNKFCTYCVVPFSRGREKSLSADKIIEHIHNLRSQGIREVHLIGQNVNSYRPTDNRGLENVSGSTAFSKLLRAVARTGIERIKFTTSFPRDFHEDIVEAINEHENLCNWVHLPVQSGSNNILKAMRRGHTIESYLKKIDLIKKSPRQIALSTDIIIGFPGETDQDFEDTMAMTEYCRFDSSYIFKYSPRPGTPAYEMFDDVSPDEKKNRFIELDKWQKQLQQEIYQSYIDRKVSVLIEKISVKDENQLSGHSTCHKVVNFKNSRKLPGEIVDVRITEAKVNTLF